MADKPIVCIDFDGVIHSYESGWHGIDIIPDPPVPGAMNWLRDMSIQFQVCIFSSRCSSSSGIKAMANAIKRWAILEYGEIPGWISRLDYVEEKPPALVTIDDRAICFDGDFDKVRPDLIKKFKPWNKK